MMRITITKKRVLILLLVLAAVVLAAFGAVSSGSDHLVVQVVDKETGKRSLESRSVGGVPQFKWLWRFKVLPMALRWHQTAG